MIGLRNQTPQPDKKIAQKSILSNSRSSSMGGLGSHPRLLSQVSKIMCEPLLMMMEEYIYDILLIDNQSKLI